MKWTRGTFEGRREDGAPIPYEGYVSIPSAFGIARNRKGKTWYAVIHTPTGCSIVPPFLLLTKLNDAKLYADMVARVVDVTAPKVSFLEKLGEIIAIAKTFKNRPPAEKVSAREVAILGGDPSL